MLRHALIAALAAAPAVAEAAPAWSRVTLPDPAVSVELPGPAVAKTKERSSMAGAVVTHTRVATDGDGWCAATVTRLPGVASLFVSDDSLLERAREKLLEDYAGTSTAWTPVKRDGHEGRRLTFSTRRDPARPETGVAELFAVDGAIVTVVALRATNAAPLDVERLFGSLDLP